MKLPLANDKIIGNYAYIYIYKIEKLHELAGLAY
jgi:hypothetical protein